MTTGALAEATPELTRFGVMKHLTVLEEAGLLFHEKRGRQRWNHLNAAPLRQLYERWVSQYEDPAAARLVALKRAVEAESRPAPSSERTTPMSTEILKTPVRAAVVQTEIEIAAEPAKVYDAYVNRFGDWFYENEESRTSRPARFENKIGGLCYMELPEGGANVLATVTMLKPGWKIRMSGDCTIPNAYIGNMTITFHPSDKHAGGTRVHIEHRMAGEFADDLPAGFEEGWADGLSKLKALVEGV